MKAENVALAIAVVAIITTMVLWGVAIPYKVAHQAERLHVSAVR